MRVFLLGHIHLREDRGELADGIGRAGRENFKLPLACTSFSLIFLVLGFSFGCTSIMRGFRAYVTVVEEFN